MNPKSLNPKTLISVDKFLGGRLRLSIQAPSECCLSGLEAYGKLSTIF